MGIDRFFHFDAADVFAAADDDVFLAVNDEQIAVLVEIAQIARAEEAIGHDRLTGGFAVVPVAVETDDRAERHFTDLARSKLAAIIVEDRHFDQRLGSGAGRAGLGHVVFVEIAAARSVGFGQAVTQQRKGVRQRVLDLADVIGRARRAACGKGGAAGQIILAAIGVGRDLEAHQRHADEIGDLFLLDQPHRLFGIPFRHQDQLASDHKALQHDRYFAGDMEQRHIDQCRGLRCWRFALVGQVRQHRQRLANEVEHRLGDCAVIRPGAFALTGRSRGVEDCGDIIADQVRQCGIGPAALGQKRGQPFLPWAIVGKFDHPGRKFEIGDPGRALGIGQHQLAIGQFDPGGHFIAGPPAVEQRRAAARHQHRHVGHDPVGRIARGDPDPVALLQAVSGHQPAGHAARGGIDFCKGGANITIDQEFRFAMLGAEMLEHRGQSGRRVRHHR